VLQGPPDAAATNAAAAAFGIALVGSDGQPLPNEAPFCEIWAEHWPAVRLFGAMQTQYRRSPLTGRVTGLDYAALPVVEQRLGIGRRQARQAFDALRVMEAHAVLHYAQQSQG
jgi:hypothetical protein